MGTMYVPSRWVAEPTDAQGLTSVTIRRTIRARIHSRWTDEHPNTLPSTRDLMRPTGLPAMPGEHVPGTAPAMQERASDTSQRYEKAAVAYASNPASVTTVDGEPERLGTHYINGERVPWTRASDRTVASSANGGKGGRKRSCSCGTCKRCKDAERKRAQRQRDRAERASIVDRDLERQLARMNDRLAIPWQ